MREEGSRALVILLVCLSHLGKNFMNLVPQIVSDSVPRAFVGLNHLPFFRDVPTAPIMLGCSWLALDLSCCSFPNDGVTGASPGLASSLFLWGLGCGRELGSHGEPAWSKPGVVACPDS